MRNASQTRLVPGKSLLVQITMPEPLAVCFLNEFFYPDNLTGTGNVVSDAARRLHDTHGFDVEAICARLSYVGEEKPSRREDWKGVRIRRVFEPNWNRKGTALRSLGNLLFVGSVTTSLLFRRKKPDVIFVTTAPPFLPLAARMMRALRGVPYVYCIYDLEPDRVLGLKVMGETSLFVRLMRRFQQASLGRASKVMAIGRCMRDRIVATYRIPPDLVEVIPIGADVETLGKPSATAKGDTFRVVYSGNFGRYHDFDSILDAAKSLAVSHPQVRFVLVGKGAQRAHVDERVASESLGTIEVKDFLDDAAYAEMLGSADVCLVTMEQGLEGTCVPSKLYAYMAAGKPTVAVVDARCEVALTVVEAGCGVAVQQADPVALADAIADLASDPDRLREMSAKAVEASHGLYSRGRSIESLANMLISVARNRQPHVDVR